MMERMIAEVESIAGDEKLRKKQKDKRYDIRKRLRTFLESPLHERYKDEVDLSDITKNEDMDEYKDMHEWFERFRVLWNAMIEAEVIKLMLADYDAALKPHKRRYATCTTWTEYGYHKVNLEIPQNILKALADQSKAVAKDRDQKIALTQNQVHYFETQGTTWAESSPDTFQHYLSKLLLAPLNRIGIFAEDVKVCIGNALFRNLKLYTSSLTAVFLFPRSASFTIIPPLWLETGNQPSHILLFPKLF